MRSSHRRPRLHSASCRGAGKRLVARSAASTMAAQPSRKARKEKVLRIAVDVDEVLGMFLTTLCRYCYEEHDMPHKPEHFWVYEFAKIWQCDQETSNLIVHDFFESPHFREGIPPIPEVEQQHFTKLQGCVSSTLVPVLKVGGGGALGSLQRLKANHDLVVVTSRQFAIQDATLDWLDAHFPGIFSGVHFGNHFAKAGTSRKKSDICLDIGADVLIDDNPKYAYDCAIHGCQVLLFNWKMGYPWSNLPDDMVHSNITVVTSWEDVEASLATLPARMLDLA